MIPERGSKLDHKIAQDRLALKRPLRNDKDSGSNPTQKTKFGHWDGPLHRRCPNGPAGSEWKTSNIKLN